MLKGLDASRRQLVAIVDPHIKRVEDFYIYKEAKDLGILLKNKDGSEYEGWCWTGSSSWVDFFDPRRYVQRAVACCMRCPDTESSPFAVGPGGSRNSSLTSGQTRPETFGSGTT